MVRWSMTSCASDSSVKSSGSSLSGVSLARSLSQPSLSSLTSATLVAPGSDFSTRQCAICLGRLIDHKFFHAIFFVLSVYVLFGDDIRLALFLREHDTDFNTLTFVALAVFSTEIVLRSITRWDYFGSFFFLLDLVATASLVLDVTSVWNFLMGYDSFSVNSSSDYATEGGVSQAGYARAGRSSRVGTRLARILRVFRLIRIIRVIREFGALVVQRPRKEASAGAQPGEFAGEVVGSESQVGKKLSERTTMTVILLVLLMLVVVPLLDPGQDAWQAMSPSSPQYGIDTISRAWADYVAEDIVNSSARLLKRLEWEQELLLYTYYHNYFAQCPRSVPDTVECASDWMHRLCFIGYIDRGTRGDVVNDHFIQKLPSSEWDSLFSEGRDEQRYIVGSLPDHAKQKLASPWQVACGGEEDGVDIVGVSFVEGTDCPWRSAFRLQELTWYHASAPGSDKHLQDAESLIVFFDVSEETRKQAFFSMGQTAFIVVVLLVASLKLSESLEEIVVRPIERMLHKVQQIRADPLSVISQVQVNDEVSLPQRSSCLGRCNCSRGRCCGRRRSRQRQPTLETKILENMIAKLGHLLALGFGEAGSQIIRRNLAGDGENVNPLVPGCWVEATCGICKIQDFTEITEVLQERTMVFVNRVAKLVHGIADDHLGANKNLGDGFMLVWRMGGLDACARTRAADLSVMSIVQIVSAVTRDNQLAAFREHPMLLARLGKSRVRLSFGLHLGWSIEGAIGSAVKIDASYLSADVNLAALLRASTRLYGVMVLLSEALVRTCSHSLSCLLRPVDRVKFQGTMQLPTRLFTIDLDIEALIPWAEHVRVVTKRASRHSRTGALSHMRSKSKSDNVLVGTRCGRLDEASRKKLTDEYKPHEPFTTDFHLRNMRTIYTAEFYQTYERGYLNYEAGEWAVASTAFIRARDMLILDGPISTLLAYMYSHSNVAPSNWPGYCELSLETSKREFHHSDTALLNPMIHV